MRSYFLLVNTFSNAAGELVSERLVPEPHVWNDDDVPPMPTDPPPQGYVPIDDGTPKYKAYVPKLADPRYPYIRAEDRVRGEEFRSCDSCGNTKHLWRKAHVKKTENSIEKSSKKRKLDEVDLPAEEAEDGPVPASGEEVKISGHSTATHETSSKHKRTVKPVKASQ